MSLKDGMATTEMETQHRAALTTEAGSSASNGSNFVKAIDRKARSYFKTLERSLSSSMAERGEDPLSMTIEFLRARLQAQRVDYKAEKQRAQQLAKKVFELEQKLSFEIERRKKAECREALISPRHRSGSFRPKDFPHCNERANMTSKELREEGLAITRSKFKDNSFYAAGDEYHHSDWRSEISGNDSHTDGDGVCLISPSCLCRHWESLRSDCQQRPYQHGSSLDKEFDATSLDKEIYNRKWLEKPVHKETREKLYGATDCDNYALHLEGKKASINSEKIKMHANTIDLKQDSAIKPWNKACSIDTEALRETGKYDHAPSEIKEVPEPAHTVLYSQPHRQAKSFWKHAGESSMAESLEHLSLEHSKNYAARAMRDQSKQYVARAMHSHQDYHGRVLLNPLHKMVSGGFTDSTTSSPSSQEHSQKGFYGQTSFVNAGIVDMEGRYSPQLSRSMSAEHDRIQGYRFAHYDNSKEMQEGRYLVRQMRNQVTEGKYVEQDPYSLRTVSSLGRCSLYTEQRAHSENFLTSHENTVPKHDPDFSTMHTRHNVKLQGRWMSLDGGLDSQQEIFKALEMAKPQVLTSEEPVVLPI